MNLSPTDFAIVFLIFFAALGYFFWYIGIL